MTRLWKPGMFWGIFTSESATGKRMDWDTIIRGLKDADYQGRIVMEPFIRPGGQVGRDIKIYRDQSQGADEKEMDRLAREAVIFIRKKLKETEGEK